MLSSLLCLFLAALTSATPIVVDSRNNVTYQGTTRNGLDVFLGVQYGQDTGGQNRFKPPQFYIPTAGSVVTATSYGIACPQPISDTGSPLGITPITNVSENCLNLNVVRPNNTCPGAGLPVMVFIHGGEYNTTFCRSGLTSIVGSFWTGSNQEISTTPDGLVLQSIENQLPVIHVAANYRLGGKENPMDRIGGD